MAKQFFNVDKIKSQKNDMTKVIRDIPIYKSEINYGSLNITDEQDKANLILAEQIIKDRQNKMLVALSDICRILYDAQKIFAKYQNEKSFTTWFEELKLSRNFVYRCIEKYRLFLEYNSQTVMELTVKDTAILTKIFKENKANKETIIEILNSEEPSKKLNEIFKEQSQKIEIDMSDFKSLDDESKKDKLKQIRLDRIKMAKLVVEKKEKIKVLMEELKQEKEQLKKVKEIEKEMKSLIF